MNDERIIRCPSCDGEGGFEREWSWSRRENGEPYSYRESCSDCDGTGEVIIVTCLAAFYDPYYAEPYEGYQREPED